MIEFSDAIELGSPLVRERSDIFYSDWPEPCGCAHGTAWAAIGKAEPGLNEAYSLKFFPICKLVLSEEEAYILDTPGALVLPGTKLGPAVSWLHGSKVPRLELARRIRLIEERHPEIPGYEEEGDKKENSFDGAHCPSHLSYKPSITGP